MADVDLKVWGSIIGWIMLVFTGGLAWGRHQAVLTAHQKKMDSFKIEDLMSVDQCRDFHDRSQEGTFTRLDAIQDNQKDMKADMRKYQVQLSAAVARIENIAGRMASEQ